MPNTGKSQATKIVDLLLNMELFHDNKGRPFATYNNNGRVETVMMRSGTFKYWIAENFYKKYKKVAGSGAIEDALKVLCGKALNEGPEKEIFVRRGTHNGNIYLDLANDKGEVIEITPVSWQVITNPPIPFIRKKGMLPLVKPEPGGMINELYQFLNLAEEKDQRLTIAWLIGSLSDGPYPILVLNGEQGTGKSVFTKILRSLVDPNEAKTKSNPNEEKDLMIGAGNSWILAYDNVSSIPDWLSDSLCRIATGGGWATRALFTDDEETIIDVKRPIILNGISDIVTRGDLMSRSMIVNMPVIPDARKQTERKMMKDFEAVKPRILGAICEILQFTLSNIDNVQMPAFPRMADFAEWITAAEPALMWQRGSFLEIFTENQDNATNLIIEDSILANEVIDLVNNSSKYWEGTAKELLSVLVSRSVTDDQAYTYFQKLTPKTLSNELRRIAPVIRPNGIDITFIQNTRKRGKKERLIEIANLAVKVNVNANP